MIKLKFTITELNEFYSYLVECVKSIKFSISDADFYERRKLSAELSEFNNCLIKVQAKVTRAHVLGKFQKQYTIGISEMQGFLITNEYESNNELGAYINAILSEKTNHINKQLV
jgi:hypothetical protein